MLMYEAPMTVTHLCSITRLKKKKLFHVTYHNFKIDVASVNITENNMRLFNKREYKTSQSPPYDK